MESCVYDLEMAATKCNSISPTLEALLTFSAVASRNTVDVVGLQALERFVPHLLSCLCLPLARSREYSVIKVTRYLRCEDIQVPSGLPSEKAGELAQP